MPSATVLARLQAARCHEPSAKPLSTSPSDLESIAYCLSHNLQLGPKVQWSVWRCGTTATQGQDHCLVLCCTGDIQLDVYACAACFICPVKCAAQCQPTPCSWLAPNVNILQGLLSLHLWHRLAQLYSGSSIYGGSLSCMKCSHVSNTCKQWFQHLTCRSG